MSHFIKDNTSPGNEKTNYTTRPEVPSDQKIGAGDWNTYRQAFLDIQSFLRGADWSALVALAADPAPAGITSYVWLKTDNTLHVKIGGVDHTFLLDAVADNSITLAKLADIATARILGRTTAGSGDPEALTGTQATALLDVATAAAKGLMPPLSGNVEDALRGDGSWGEVTSAVGYITPEQHGAVGDGTTDDRAAFVAAIAAVLAVPGSFLKLGGSDKTYKLSKYVAIENARGVRIVGEGATILYSSDDTAIATDATATSNEQARSCFLLRYCQDTIIGPGITFRGGTHRNYTTNNLGSAVYATRCRRTVVQDVRVLWGYSTIQQTQEAPTSGTGDSLAYADGILTLTDAAGSFKSGHVGMTIALAGCTNQGNHGVFRIVGYTSPTTITIACATGVTETGSFTWQIDDADDHTELRNIDQYGCRGTNRLPRRCTVIGGSYRWPVETMDTCGVGNSLAIDGSTVTLTCHKARFKPYHHGKYIRISGATSGGNNGYFGPITYISATQVSFANASGVTERFPSTTGLWWIMSGTKCGVGAGSGAIAKSGNTVTLTVDGTPFTGDEIGMTVFLRNPTSVANIAWAYVTAVPANNQIQYEQSDAVAEDFSGVWSLDDWDSNSTAGSTHAFYLHAANDINSSGRSEARFIGVHFEGNRTTCIKLSGSASPMRDVVIQGCTAVNCSGFVIFGADDAQEHSALSVIGNTLIDCGNYQHRLSPGTSPIEVLGARGVTIAENTLYYTRDSIQTVSPLGNNTEHYGIHVRRYRGGLSQPIDDATIVNNKLAKDLNNSINHLFECGILVTGVGRRAKHRTGGTLTKSGNIMTLTDTSAHLLEAEDVGKSITIVNAPNAGNNGTFVVESVPTGTTLTFTNASGVGGGVSAGTWRLTPLPSTRLGACHVTGNQILQTAKTGIRVSETVSPQIVGNTFAYCEVNINVLRCAFAFVDQNTTMGNATQRPTLQIESTCAWPIVGTNGTSGVTQVRNSINRPRGWDVAIDGSSAEDHPLLGTHGRCVPSGGFEEIVFAYGAGHVDGDTIVIVFDSNTHTFTYKASSPGANQFNSAASLIALIDAITDLNADDYGADFSTPVTTNHIRIRRTAQSTTNGAIQMTTSVLNDTALVALYNRSGSTSNSRCDSVGCGSAGPTADKAVVWSPLANLHSAVALLPGNADARTTLQANGPAFKATDQYNGGACEVMDTGTTSGTEEFRWAIH